MKESYAEGIADHSGSESGAYDREVICEAMTGVSTGGTLSCEKDIFRALTLSHKRKATRSCTTTARA